MAVLTLTAALSALLLALVGFYFALILRERTASQLASLAQEVAELKKAREEDEKQAEQAGAAWEEGLNNMMAYTLKGYGLNTDFLKQEGDVDG